MIWIPVLALLAVVFLWLLFWPIPTDGLISRPDPASGYQEALRRIQALEETEAYDGPLLEVCRSKLLTHGRPTEHALVLFHGYTNCPEQFAQLGRRFHAKGYNVYIPRLPYHGYKDRMTRDIAKLTAEDLVTYGDCAVDIACGLGRQITVMGFSAGGVVAAWLAQNRADIQYAVPIAASIGISFVPVSLTQPLIRLFRALPRFFLWWDPRTRKENPLSVYHAYPRYASRSLVEILRLGVVLDRQARHSRPATHSILLITNACEPGVNNAAIGRLAELWRKHQDIQLRRYAFEETLCLPHDLLTPGTPGVPTEEICNRLVEQVERLHKEKSAQCPNASIE
jgi:carboxylesterase